MYPLKKTVEASIRDNHADNGGFASKVDKTAAVVIWNYHDDDTLDQPINAELEKSGQLQILESPRKLKISNNLLQLSIDLSIQGVSLLKIDCE